MKRFFRSSASIALLSILIVLGMVTIGIDVGRATVETTSEGQIHKPGLGNPAKISSEENATTNVHTIRGTTEPRVGIAADVHAPAANTAAVVTYAAVAAKKHVVTGFVVSYSGSGTMTATTNIKVEDVSGTVIFSQDVDAKDVYQFVFPAPKKSAVANTAFIITAAAGGANVTGKISVLNHWTED